MTCCGVNALTLLLLFDQNYLLELFNIFGLPHVRTSGFFKHTPICCAFYLTVAITPKLFRKASMEHFWYRGLW
jgi:hypothetical protein